MHKEAVEALEFHRILDAVSSYTHGEPSLGAVSGIRPLSSADEIKKRFGLVADIRRLNSEGAPLSFLPFSDISGLIERVRPEDSLLEPLELYSFVPVLFMLSDISETLSGRPDLRCLSELALEGFPELLGRIESSIDGEGRILDEASPELYEIRTRKRTLDGRIRKRLEDIIKDRGVAPFLQEPFFTRRTGRWVIPVRMDSKGQVQGLVHDVSRTGETAFVEPLEIIGLANELENLVAEEKTEEIRILKAISKKVRAEADLLISRFDALIYLDVLNAIASLSDRLRCSVPEINEGSLIDIRGGRHPLLMLLKDSGGVVPLDIRLDAEGPVMVITGPNAGGKTIAIKTAGLLQMMALSGMPVPADGSSSFPLLKEILVDIGDEQSIESSLSTFSAHVSNIARIIERAGAGTLVLMDELGTGTDPAEGAALSCAVLRELKDKGSFVLATTHLVDIVGFVHKTDGMLNASMEFDRSTLSPLYRLRAGEPGESHALLTAEKFGMPGGVLRLARELLGSLKAELQRLLRDLMERRAFYEEKVAGIEGEKARIREKEALLSKRLSDADVEKKSILVRAYEESREIIREAKKEVQAALRDEKQSKERLKRLAKIETETEKKAEAALPPAPPPEELKAGDKVFVRSLGKDAEIVEVDAGAGRIKVRTRGITADVPISSVSLPREKETSESGYKAPKGAETARDEEAATAELNIIGLRVDEALARLERFLNDAVLGGLDRLVIIHGLGTGALLKAVRGHLKGHPLVKELRGGKQSEGGEGVTVVALK